MQMLSQHSSIVSIDTEDFLLGTTMLDLELAKSYMQDCTWDVTHSIHIYTLKILFQAHPGACCEFESCYLFFFLHYPRYSNVRNTYLSGYLHMHTVQELLHSKVTATNEDNETMFCHDQEFIVKSKHFL